MPRRFSASNAILVGRICAPEKYSTLLLIIGMFFDDGSQDNCILNTASRQTDPDLYVPAPGERVDYFEPNCGARRRRQQRKKYTQSAVKRESVSFAERLQLHTRRDEQRSPFIRHTNNDQINTVLSPDAQWGEWTPCNPMTEKQQRYRLCTHMSTVSCETSTRSCTPVPAVKDFVERRGLRKCAKANNYQLNSSFP